LDLRLKFGEAGIAMLTRNVVTANLIRHAALL
jgi:hypothetical protein